MARKKAGLYLGVSSVGVSLSEGKKLLFLHSEDFSSVDIKEAEVSNESLRLQALVRKSFRHANIEEKEVCLSLADRDFIVRSIELPLMKKNEMESAIIYEVEKYIPFKLEELAWDYQYNRLSNEKKIAVSFVAIRRSGLDRVKKFLNNMNLKEVAVEPSCISLARFLKSSPKTKNLENFALLDLTSGEAYLTFFQKDLPVFNRYLSVEKNEDGFDFNNFSEVVKFSFQYFRREFKETYLDKLLLLTSEVKQKDIAPVLEESLSLKVEVINPYDLVSRQRASVESLKAFGSAVRDQYPYKFKPALKGVEVEKEDSFELAEKENIKIAWRWGLLATAALASLLMYFVVHSLYGNALVAAERRFSRKEASLDLPSQLQETGWQGVDAALAKKQEKIQTLIIFKKNRAKIANFLKSISKKEVVPLKTQFERVRITKDRRGQYQAEIAGYIYRGSDHQERAEVNNFVNNLRKDLDVSVLFSSVELSFVRRRIVKGFEVTEFLINLT